MAEVVESMPVDRMCKVTYHWDEWLDGRVWKLVVGVDFTCSFKSMRNHCYVAARNRHKRVTVRTDGNGTVYLQARPREQS